MFKITSSNKEVQAEYDRLHTRINLLEKSKEQINDLLDAYKMYVEEHRTPETSIKVKYTMTNGKTYNKVYKCLRVPLQERLDNVGRPCIYFIHGVSSRKYGTAQEFFNDDKAAHTVTLQHGTILYSNNIVSIEVIE